MPLPDASKKSPRVYTLLQNTDLDNVTFDNIQAVGNPIAIEEANEDEMRRLVLVNLCRLVTSGEWTGLLESGGGDPFTWQNSEEYNVASGYGGSFWNIATQSPICSNATLTTLAQYSEYQFYNPFVAPFTGAPSAVNINVTVATTSQNLYVAFYSGTNGLPATMLGYATIATDTTGIQRVTSFTEASSGSLTFTAGQMYYYSTNKAGTENPTLSASTSNGSMGQLFADQAATVNSNMVLGIQSDAVVTSAPADVAADDLWNGGAGWTARIWVWLEK
ncbi:MAG TPA: hypothetical protein EYN66_19825 [Myxococcales bacterium]|nr:hypothetical protein [Myxococcales bacterium]